MATVVMLSSDLIFATKVTGTAEACGLSCRTAGSERAFRAALDSDDLRLVIVDMELTPATLDACAELLTGRAGLTTIAYYPHVRADLRERAASLMLMNVMPRSRFSAELNDIIGRIAAS